MERLEKIQRQTKRQIEEIVAAEPNSWAGEFHGFPCFILRNDIMQILCGYAGVPKGHPLYGVEASKPSLAFFRDHREGAPSETDPLEDAGYRSTPAGYFNVHGGVTYSRDHLPSVTTTLYKVNYPSEHWWFGFDCGHGGDYIPHKDFMAINDVFGGDAVYRTLEYVKEELEALAKQLLHV